MLSITPLTVVDTATLLALLCAAFLTGHLFERGLLRRKGFGQRHQHTPPPRRRPDLTVIAGTRARQPARVGEQLEAVLRAQFTARHLLNRSETRVFHEVSRIVRNRNPEWYVMAQVSLGEVLRADDQDAFFAINSKRVDILLLDGAFKPMHALEYQGRGHYQGAAAGRDAVKKEALRRAGIGYHEIVAGHTTPSELQRLLVRLVPANVESQPQQA